MLEAQEELTTEKANAELKQIKLWLDQLQQMQQQLPNMQARANYLRGWLDRGNQTIS